jgi:hypothetical protein
VPLIDWPLLIEILHDVASPGIVNVNVQLFAAVAGGMLIVPVDEPLVGPDVTCKNHGLVDPSAVARHVTWSPSIVPDALLNVASQLARLSAPVSPNDRLVILARVCVVCAYPDVIAVRHLSVAPRAGTANCVSPARPVNCDLVVPIGVMNGEIAVLPLESVRFGVANAGEATTTNADTNTNTTSKLPLKAFIYSHPFKPGQPPKGRQANPNHRHPTPKQPTPGA